MRENPGAGGGGEGGGTWDGEGGSLKSMVMSIPSASHPRAPDSPQVH